MASASRGEALQQLAGLALHLPPPEQRRLQHLPRRQPLCRSRRCHWRLRQVHQQQQLTQRRRYHR